MYSTPTTSPVHHFDRQSDIPTIPIDLDVIPKIALVIGLIIGASIAFRYWRDAKRKEEDRQRLRKAQAARERTPLVSPKLQRLVRTLRLDSNASGPGLRVYDIVDPDEFVGFSRDELKTLLCMQESGVSLYETEPWNPETVTLKQQGTRLYLSMEEWEAAVQLEEERRQKRG